MESAMRNWLKFIPQTSPSIYYVLAKIFNSQISDGTHHGQHVATRESIRVPNYGPFAFLKESIYLLPVGAGCRNRNIGFVCCVAWSSFGYETLLAVMLGCREAAKCSVLCFCVTDSAWWRGTRFVEMWSRITDNTLSVCPGLTHNCFL